MKALQDFYIAYGVWLDRGAPDGEPFWRNEGLCDNWIGQGIHKSGRALAMQFAQAGRDRHYPFGGAGVFDDEEWLETMHLNPIRIAWVRARIAGKPITEENGGL